MFDACFIFFSSFSPDLIQASDSDSDIEFMAQSHPNPPPKRRRVLDPSAITAVAMYPNMVKY